MRLRFVAIASLEGLYAGGEEPLIVVNSLRPPGRRAVTCAHELGHHFFGHGDRVDRLLKSTDEETRFDPVEYTASRFAMALLLPKLAVERAFARRGWDARRPTAVQLYVVATYLGVGYSTLATYMQRTLGVISAADAEILLARAPKDIRAEIIGAATPGNVIVADRHWDGRPIDLEIDDLLLVPSGTLVAGRALICDDIHGRCVFRAAVRGSARVYLPSGEWSRPVRVTPKEYQGLSKYRYLEDPDDET